MQASFAPAFATQIPCVRWRTYTPPCAPSSSSQGPHRKVLTRAGKDGKDDKAKRSESKADFSALWALRVKNFFSSRQKYLQQAEKGGEQAEDKAFQAEMAREEQELRKMRREIMEEGMADLRKAQAEGIVKENDIASDIVRARLDLQSSPVTKVALAVVAVRDLLRALLLLPFTAMGAAIRGWQALFATQRYENFLMSEGERIWHWRNRMENERWFWEVLVWDQLLFPILAIVCYEYLVPNHFLWAVVAPIGLLAWLQGRLATPATPEFWMLAYFGFYRKVWPEWWAWLTNYVWPVLAWG